MNASVERKSDDITWLLGRNILARKEVPLCVKKPIIEVSIEVYHPDSCEDLFEKEVQILENHITEVLNEMMKHIDLDKE